MTNPGESLLEQVQERRSEAARLAMAEAAACPDPAAGLAAARRAVEHYRQLERFAPGRFTQDFLDAGRELIGRLLATGGPGHTNSSGEIADLERETERLLLAADPAAATPAIQVLQGVSQANQSIDLARQDRPQAALVNALKAVETLRPHAQSDGLGHTSTVAWALNTCADRLAALDRLAEAVECERETLALYRRADQAVPGCCTAELAKTLKNLSIHLNAADPGPRPEAVALGGEAVELFRPLVALDPGRHEPDLATALNALAPKLYFDGQVMPAMHALKEAILLRQVLALRDPATHQEPLEQSLALLELIVKDIAAP